MRSGNSWRHGVHQVAHRLTTVTVVPGALTAVSTSAADAGTSSSPLCAAGASAPGRPGGGTSAADARPAAMVNAIIAAAPATESFMRTSNPRHAASSSRGMSGDFTRNVRKWTNCDAVPAPGQPSGDASVGLVELRADRAARARALPRLRSTRTLVRIPQAHHAKAIRVIQKSCHAPGSKYSPIALTKDPPEDVIDESAYEARKHARDRSSHSQTLCAFETARSATEES